MRKNPGRIFTTEYCCPTDSLELHRGKDDFRIKTPWYANQWFDVLSVVNSYLISLLIAGFLVTLLSCDFSFKGKPDSEIPGWEMPGTQEPVSWDAAQPLHEPYKDYFLMGNIVSPGDIANVRFNILKRHFNTATAENNMKPNAIAPSSQPSSNAWNYQWTQADDIVKEVTDAGLKMHGHTLIWHNQTPGWLYSGDKATVLANLEKYVTDVATHFKGKLISWDVVNEAMRDGLSAAEAADWKTCLRTGGWNTIGPEYIEKAFLAARAADPDAQLFYNDYSLNSFQGNNKQRAVYNMVREINNKYPDAGGRPLIDGIGMQSHHHLNTTPESVEESIILFSSLGVDITISEMDIMAAKSNDNNLTNTWDDNAAQLQAQKYAAMFRIFKNHASKISRVTFWGLDDRTSWRASSYPTLLDKDYNVKPAFYAVVNPNLF
jgi:endo-1,4-beta-xylanase